MQSLEFPLFQTLKKAVDVFFSSISKGALIIYNKGRTAEKQFKIIKTTTFQTMLFSPTSTNHHLTRCFDATHIMDSYQSHDRRPYWSVKTIGNV